jgi:hypothetical protein
MKTRTLMAIALLLAAGACNRQAADNSGNAANTTNAAAPPNAAAPAPAANAASTNTTTAPEGDVRPGPEPDPAPALEEEAREGCAGEIGLAKARELVRQCILVSPATRPPCNTANSCELIQDEIDRSCAMISEDKPAFCPQG